MCRPALRITPHRCAYSKPTALCCPTGAKPPTTTMAMLRRAYRHVSRYSAVANAPPFHRLLLIGMLHLLRWQAVRARASRLKTFLRSLSSGKSDPRPPRSPSPSPSPSPGLRRSHSTNELPLVCYQYCYGMHKATSYGRHTVPGVPRIVCNHGDHSMCRRRRILIPTPIPIPRAALAARRQACCTSGCVASCDASEWTDHIGYALSNHPSH
jgi:hypothetical protein